MNGPISHGLGILRVVNWRITGTKSLPNALDRGRLQPPERTAGLHGFPRAAMLTILPGMPNITTGTSYVQLPQPATPVVMYGRKGAPQKTRRA